MPWIKCTVKLLCTDRKGLCSVLYVAHSVKWVYSLCLCHGLERNACINACTVSFTCLSYQLSLWLQHTTQMCVCVCVSDLTFLQLSVPHFDDEGRVFAVVDDPQRQSLDALLRAAQLRQLLLQGGLREGRHAGEWVCASLVTGPTPTSSNATEPRAILERPALSSKLKLCC